MANIKLDAKYTWYTVRDIFLLLYNYGLAAWFILTF